VGGRWGDSEKSSLYEKAEVLPNGDESRNALEWLRREVEEKPPVSSNIFDSMKVAVEVKKLDSEKCRLFDNCLLIENPSELLNPSELPNSLLGEKRTESVI
jgi:hypothetical protein